jgi:hypothetical protein
VRVGGGGVVDNSWVDCDRATVKRRAGAAPQRRRASEVARRRARAGNRLRHRNRPCLFVRRGRARRTRLWRRPFSRHVAKGAGALRQRAPAVMSRFTNTKPPTLSRPSCSTACCSAVLQHHAAPPDGIALRLGGAAAGRTACHHGCAAALRALRQMAVAVQLVADETHDAGLPAHPALAGTRRALRRFRDATIFVRLVLYLPGRQAAEPVAAAKASNGEAAIDPAYRIAAE